MSVTLVVVLAALVAAAIVWFLSRSSGEKGPVDAAREERWLVHWLLRHPRWGSAARSIDHHVAGGLMLVVALAVLFAIAIVLGLLLDMVDSGSGLAAWDRAVAEWGSSNATDRSTDVLGIITDLGGSGYLIAIFVAVAAIDFVRNRNADVVWFLFTVLAGVVLINNGLKMLVGRARPDVSHLVGAAGSSFPSGHSAAASACWFALALVIGRRWSRRRRAALATAASVVVVAVAASRALLGVHWLTDVVGGVMVGWGWFMLCALVFGGRMQQLGDPVDRLEKAVVHEAEPVS